MLHNSKRKKKENLMKTFASFERKKQVSLMWGSIGLFLLLAFDQITKLLAYTLLRTKGAFILIPGVFELRYLENQGAAFGMLKNMQWIFIFFALMITIGAVWFYIRMPMEKKFFPLRILCVTLVAGALGNMIDRILHKYVIDFLYFSLINFPIFNVADIYVCASTAVFLVLTLIYYKEEDFDSIMGKKSEQEYVSEIIEKIQESRQNLSSHNQK